MRSLGVTGPHSAASGVESQIRRQTTDDRVLGRTTPAGSRGQADEGRQTFVSRMFGARRNGVRRASVSASYGVLLSPAARLITASSDLRIASVSCWLMTMSAAIASGRYS